MTASIADSTGRCPRVGDPLMRAAHAWGVEIAARFYPPGTADWDQKARQVALHEGTAEFLYRIFTPLTPQYSSGSRPELERVLARILRPSMTEREKVFAILQYCHHDFRKDYRSPLPKGVICLNAREEEILKLGGGQCEDRSRLIICLCQMAGLPARFVASSCYWDPEDRYATRGGHAIVEIYIEGGWAFFDSLRDFYCLRPDGRIADLWHLITHPEIVEDQPDKVYAACGADRESFTHYRNQNLSRRQIITLTNYSCADHGRYDWTWKVFDVRPGSAECAELAAFRRVRKTQLLAECGVVGDFA